MIPARRTHGFRESVIRGMTRLAREHRSINLAQGFPNFPAPDLLKEAAVRAIHDDVNQYAITWGAQRLREALARKYHDWYGLPVDADREITVSCGATEGMIATLLAVVDPGDEVIVFEPFYENYGPDAILSDAKPVSTLQATPREGFSGARNCKQSRSSASKTTRSRSPTKSTSTFGSRESTSPSPRSPACQSGP